MKLKKVLGFIFAEKEDISFENRLFLLSIAIGTIFSILGVILSLCLGSSINTTIVIFLLFCMLGILYYFVRFRGIFRSIIIPVIVVSFIGTSLIWIFNGGINGSNIMVGLVVLILGLICVSDKNKIWVISLFVFLNIIIYLIQLYRPDLITNLPSEANRWTDSLITAISSAFIIFLIIKFLHKHYTLERQRAEESEKQLLKINSDRDKFFSIIAHDMRSPFNTFLGLTKMMAENLDTFSIREIQEIVMQMSDSATNLYSLLDNLLQWTRMKQGLIPFEPRNLNFIHICQSAVEVLKPNADIKNITIHLPEGDELNVFADSEMLKTVMRNLVSNAIKFTKNGGQINISALQTSDNVIISVSDNGIGIDPENLSKLFNISHIQTTKGTAEEKGTGLGLLLCQEFVEMHGGKIWVESELNKGSRFIFTLPHLQED
jgi:signal transduction histidine kinase